MLLLKSGRLDLDSLITHRLPLSAADKAINLLMGKAGKALLIPSLGRCGEEVISLDHVVPDCHN